MLHRPTMIALFAVTAPLVWAAPAHAKSYKGRVVKIRKVDGRIVVGKVVEENVDDLVVELKLGRATIPREDIAEIIDAQAIIDEYESKKKLCKTGDDLYQLGRWAEEKELDRSYVRAAMEAAIKADKDQEQARKWLGWRKVPDGLGGFDWVYRGEEGVRKGVEAELSKKKSAIRERPWEENEIILKLPEGNPVYEIHSNCPPDLAERYGNFMVKLRTNLARLVQQVQRRNITMTRRGLSKVFICNSQKLFMEITGQSPGVGGFYTPGYFAPAEDEKCIVAFHGTFGDSGDTYKVLAHEGTHQLQGLMWQGNFAARPAWLIEGLAVYFGDGHVLNRDGSLSVGIPRDRLNPLRRAIRANRYTKFPQFLNLSYQQFTPFHYAQGWGLIHWMIHSGEKLNFKGTNYDLKVVFGKFLDQNINQGFPNLPALLGATTREEMMAVCAQMEEPWKRYIEGLTPPSVGSFDKRNSRKFISKKIGFSIELPKGRKFSEWSYSAEADLKEGELVALVDRARNSRFTISQRANITAEQDVERLSKGLLPYLNFKYENLQRLPDELISLRGQKVLALNFTGKERKSQVNQDPYTNPIRMRILLYLAGENYFLLSSRADEEHWDEAKEEFDSLIAGFSILTQKPKSGR